MSSLKIKILKLPKNPGVYIFKDKAGDVLYVGKATNLRSRVGSYFSTPLTDKKLGVSRPKRPKDTKLRHATARNLDRPIEYAIDQIADIEVRETDSVLEALILEAQLIKKLQPKYNAMGKDDKSFSYFVITKEDFPRVLILRATDLPPHPQPLSLKRERGVRVAKTFGPYTSKKQMEIALKILRKIFPFHSNNQKTERGCLDFQIGRCPGPYAGAISKADYMKNIRGIRMILEGRKKGLIKKLETEMKNYAKNNEFEKAADARNKVFALKHIRDVALIASDEKLEIINQKSETIRIEAYDISNISGAHAVGSMVVFKNNEPDKSQYRKFKIKTVEGTDDVGMMREVLLRRFQNDWPQPDLILLDGGKGHLFMAERLLQELNLEMPMVTIAKGKSRKNLNFQFSIFNQFSIPKFSNLKNIINDKNLIKRIMDEAHRFAITYHKKLRRKNLLS
ncbi:MAG: GIY-YIG nuclease family protein [Parcubacteria group bacterium]|jgi:excinuclease ABC subunit C